jgi:branched-chain amino acid transport system permease protein
MSSRANILAVIALTGIMALLPLVLRNNYYLSVLIIIGLNTILALGLNLLMGYAGQISLGHAAFFGLGAYTSGILTTSYNVHPIAALVIALVFVGVVAYIVGVPSLRLRGYFLGMATLGFGIIVSILLKEMSFITQGPSGFRGIPEFSAFGFVFDSDLKYYYLIWTCTIIILMLSANIINSRIGRALRAIHTSESAAGSLGVNIQSYKLAIFVLSALYASLAGSLYAHFIGFISPSSFGFHKSIVLVTMVVVGGMASVWGAIFGASVLTLLPELLMVFEDYEIVVYGLILMLIMIFLPEGLTRGVVERIKGRISR